MQVDAATWHENVRLKFVANTNYSDELKQRYLSKDYGTKHFVNTHQNLTLKF